MHSIPFHHPSFWGFRTIFHECSEVIEIPDNPFMTQKEWENQRNFVTLDNLVSIINLFHREWKILKKNNACEDLWLFFSWLEKFKRIFSFSTYAICYIVSEISEKNEEVWLFLYFSKEWKIRGILSLSTSLACLSYQSLKWIFGKIQLNSKISFLKVLNCSWMKVQYYAITIFAMQSIINSCKITEVSKRTNPIYLEINTITCCQPLLNQYREPH